MWCSKSFSSPSSDTLYQARFSSEPVIFPTRMIAATCGAFGGKVNPGLTARPLLSIEDAMIMAMIGPFASTGGAGCFPLTGPEVLRLRQAKTPRSRVALHTHSAKWLIRFGKKSLTLRIGLTHLRCYA